MAEGGNEVTKTEKYGLNLPSDNDFVDIETLNENWKKVDQALATLNALTATIQKKSLRVAVDGDTLCFSGGLDATADEELTSVAFTNLSFGALPVSADTDNWAVTEGDLQVSAELSGQTTKFVARVEEG